MQSHTTSTEICSLLDNVLQTLHLLKSALEQHVPIPSVQAPPEPEEPAPVVPRRIAPVLTIKLSDLQRERDKAQRRRAAPPPHRPPLRKAHPRRHLPEVEVIYRRGVLKRVS